MAIIHVPAADAEVVIRKLVQLLGRADAVVVVVFPEQELLVTHKRRNIYRPPMAAIGCTVTLSDGYLHNRSCSTQGSVMHLLFDFDGTVTDSARVPSPRNRA